MRVSIAPNRRVSIPFIAGQWSLPERAHVPKQRLDVSIPFIAGQWSLQQDPALHGVRLSLVSIPFIAGQWSLRVDSSCSRSLAACFNPLHCGAVVASGLGVPGLHGQDQVSIPFIAGQWSLR